MSIEHDEIGVLARVTMTLGTSCLAAIDQNIARALRASQWEDMHKWHRVRLRVQRLRQQQGLSDAVDAQTVSRRARAGDAAIGV